MATTEGRGPDPADTTTTIADTTVNAYLRAGRHNTMRHRLRKQTRPHLILAGLWLAAAAGHVLGLATGDATVAVAVAAVALAAAAVVALARRKRRRSAGRLTGGILAAAGWAAWVIVTGPSWTTTAVLLCAGYTASLGWWRRWRIPDPPPDPPPPQGPDPNYPPRLWEQNIGNPTGKLPGSRLEHEDVIDTGLRYLAPLVPGKQELGDALAALPKLRSGLRLRHDQDLIVERPDPTRHPRADESVISVTIVRRSKVLSDAVPWPGPTYHRAGGTGTIKLGPYIDGEGVAEWLVHADNGAWGGFLAGSTGSGKSRMLDSIAMGLAAAGFVVWYGDPQGGASSAFLMQHADHQARTGAAIRDLLRLAQHVKRLRQAENALHGWEGWTPDQHRPGLAIIIDECHAALDDPECQRLCAELAREGRKLGMVLILASQVATLDAFGAGGGADALRSSVCSGNLLILRSKTHNTKNVLPGVDVDPTKFPRIPGYAYLIDDTGIRRSAPLRGFYLTDEARDQWGEQITWPALDEGAAGAAGDGYRNRRYQAEVDRIALGEWVTALRDGREPSADHATAAAYAEPAEPATRSGGQPASFGGLRVFPPIRWADWQNQHGRPQPEPAGPRTSVEVVYDLVAEGVSSPGELQTRSGYSETGVRKALRQLEEAGRVRRDRHGVWTPTSQREEVTTG